MDWLWGILGLVVLFGLLAGGIPVMPWRWDNDNPPRGGGSDRPDYDWDDNDSWR